MRPGQILDVLALRDGLHATTLLGSGRDERRADRAVALEEHARVLGQRRHQRLGDLGARERRDLGRLEHDRVARDERRDREQQHLVEAQLPRRKVCRRHAWRWPPRRRSSR